MRVILAIAQCSAKSGWAVWAVAEREGDNIQQEVPLFSVSWSWISVLKATRCRRENYNLNIWASVISVGGLGLSPVTRVGCLRSLSSCDWFLVLFASWAAADTCPGPALAVAWAPQLWVGHGPGNISRLVGPDQVRHSETSQPDISRAESRTCKNNSGVKILAFCDCRTGTAGVLRDCDDCVVMRGNKMIRWCLMTQYSYRSSSAQIVMRRKPIELNNTIKQ